MLRIAFRRNTPAIPAIVGPQQPAGDLEVSKLVVGIGRPLVVVEQEDAAPVPSVDRDDVLDHLFRGALRRFLFLADLGFGSAAIDKDPASSGRDTFDRSRVGQVG